MSDYYNIVGGNSYDILDKERLMRDYINYTFIRLQSMFEYSGLPETIPQKMLEFYLQSNGNACICEANDGNLYAFTGGLGGVPDAYFQPTEYIIANPYLNFNKSIKIGYDGILVWSDSLRVGLYPMVSKYANLLTENDITLRNADINLRLMSIFSASDNSTKRAVEVYLQQLQDGKLGVIGETPFLDGLKISNAGSNTANYLTQLIEYHQYLKAGLYNDIGLDANFNMKRETLNSSEIEMNSGLLLPLVDDMLRNRREGIEKINRMFGTNIEVELYSSWSKEQPKVSEQSEIELEEQSTTEEGGENE